MREVPYPDRSPRAPRDVYSPSRLNAVVKQLLEQSFPQVWVEGEISNLSIPSSGHAYFSLKDRDAQVRCALFRNRAQGLARMPRDGDQVLVRARASLYGARGEFQLVVEYVEAAGEGALRRALEELKTRLAAEGLFAAGHKRPLPRLAHCVGIITSPTGAAIRDIITTFKRRFPAIPLIVYPVSVQGDAAADEIIAMLKLAEQRQECDLLILARGGGSLEDLRAFNEEAVARAIHRCAIPIVTGVGHETDLGICDLVADQRAATPTAAAELASPDQNEWSEHLGSLNSRLIRQARDALDARSQRVDWLAKRLSRPDQLLRSARLRLRSASRLLVHVMGGFMVGAGGAHQRLAARLNRQSPHIRLERLKDRFEHVRRRAALAVKRGCEQEHHRLRALAGRLNGVSPLATLDRGYAVVMRADGHVITDAKTVALDSDVRVRLARGRLDCLVRETHEH